jgi:hypothetical protein
MVQQPKWIFQEKRGAVQRLHRMLHETYGAIPVALRNLRIKPFTFFVVSSDAVAL